MVSRSSVGSFVEEGGLMEPMTNPIFSLALKLILIAQLHVL